MEYGNGITSECNIPDPPLSHHLGVSRMSAPPISKHERAASASSFTVPADEVSKGPRP